MAAGCKTPDQATWSSFERSILVNYQQNWSRLLTSHLRAGECRAMGEVAEGEDIADWLPAGLDAGTLRGLLRLSRPANRYAAAGAA